ncbi:MAG: T9SS type A sorting domain-containing protein [Chlorobiota bacterium]|nr:MAG: T9SS type A sorting domain-containing protein [Chlorobiota bacterium]
MIKKYAFLFVFITIILGLYFKRSNSTTAGADRVYVGEQTCMAANCHEKAYSPESSYKGAQEFMNTFHQKIHLRPSPSTVRNESDFVNNKVVKLRYFNTDSVEYNFSKEGFDYYIQFKLIPSGDASSKMKVEYTYGGNGWMQRFLVKINDQYYYPPFQFSGTDYKEWKDSNRYYAIDVNKWSYLDTTTGHYKLYNFNTQQFRNVAYDKTCVYCHVNGFSTKVEIVGNDTTYRGSWYGKDKGDLKIQDLNMNIGCESCHGPGSEHVANPIKGNISNANNWGNSVSSTDRKLDLCGQCHTRMASKGFPAFTYPYVDSLKRSFLPGDTLFNFQKSPTAGGQYNCDGIHSYAHHQTVQDYRHSVMYKKHALVDGCWECHSPHTNGNNGLPFQLKRDFYSLSKGEGCLVSGCHADKASTIVNDKGLVVNGHTKHSLESSKCVNCHFFKGAVMRFTNGRDFSNHTFMVVKPEVTKQYRNCNIPQGMPNTCALSCHNNGRGNRNSKPGDKEAPFWGVEDDDAGDFRQNSDIELADSLMKKYAIMYPEYSTAIFEKVEVTSTSINSISPNPAITNTLIKFGIKYNEDLKLTVSDLDGHEVKLLAFGAHNKGSYNVNWNLTDELGQVLPSGVYIINLKTSRTNSSQKMIIMNNK